MKTLKFCLSALGLIALAAAGIMLWRAVTGLAPVTTDLVLGILALLVLGMGLTAATMSQGVAVVNAKPESKTKDLRRRFALGMASLFCTLTLMACGGGGTAVATQMGLTATQFETFLEASPTFKKLADAVTSNTGDIKTITTVVNQIALVAHAPGTSVIPTATGDARTAELKTVGARVSTIDFGQCSGQGTYIGSGSPDPSSAVVDFFKQCTGVTYGVNTTTILPDGNFPVAAATEVWFVDANCDATDGVIEFPSDGSYNYRTLFGGVAFISQADGKEYWVPPSGSTTIPSNQTSASDYTVGVGCTNVTETHPGFTAVLNVTDGVNGSGVPAEVNLYIL